MPYGVGTPNTAAGNTGKAIDDGEGSQQGSRYIDPRSRAYVINDDGRIKGMPNLRHLVLHTLMTELGSSAQPGLGLKPASGVIGRDIEFRRDSDVRNALADLVNRGLIEVVSVTVDRTSRPVLTLVRFRDLTTNEDPDVIGF